MQQHVFGANYQNPL